MAHGDDRACDGCLAVAGWCTLDETAVDLQLVHRVTHQRTEAGIAGAEVVQAQADAFVAQVGQCLVHEIDIVGQRAFVDLQRQHLCRHARGLDQAHHFSEEVRPQQLQGGDVHGNGEVVEALVAPQAGLLERALQHPGADLHDDAQSLGGAHEALRHQHAQRGGLPAQQRLHAHHMAVAGTDQRLVAKLQLTVGDRVDDLARDDALAVRARRGIHCMDAHRVSTFAGCLVQRILGVVEQSRGVTGVFRAQAHPQLAGHEQRVRQHRQGQLHLLPDLLGEVLRQRHVGVARDRDQELVAAMPPQFAATAQVGLQPLRHQHQRLVTHLGAHVLVD